MGTTFFRLEEVVGESHGEKKRSPRAAARARTDGEGRAAGGLLAGWGTRAG